MSLRTITVERYVTPLREGGSLPAIIEADDQGLYVLKFRGAGQGTKVLVAELVAGELARLIGLPIPELVFANLDVDLARSEPDPEVQSLIRASGGLNIAMDYLPGSVTFDPIAQEVEPLLASKIVWFDAFITNVDRTPRNANMLMWHKKLWLIDHGASLYVHYDWSTSTQKAVSPFPLIKDHVLLSRATQLEQADAEIRTKLNGASIQSVVNQIPSEWLESVDRSAYQDFLEARLQASSIFLKEAISVRSAHI